MTSAIIHVTSANKVGGFHVAIKKQGRYVQNGKSEFNMYDHTTIFYLKGNSSHDVIFASLYYEVLRK